VWDSEELRDERAIGGERNPGVIYYTISYDVYA
jgi:hypothetical protein